MKAKSLIPVVATFTVAGLASVGAATVTVSQIESRSIAAVTEELRTAGFDWVDIGADGLQVQLTGTAPDEADRFRALSVAGSVVDGARVTDSMEVAQAETITAPDFSIEVLRSGDGITLIGLIPAEMDRLGLLEQVARVAFDSPITDLLQTASFPAPETWDDAVEFGIEALRRSDKAKVSIMADNVSVTTLAQDETSRDKLRRQLEGLAPEGVEVALDITAPRPVISPFLLRVTREDAATSFDACAAGTEAGRDRIVAAARDLGVENPRCELGLGVPSPAWPQVTASALEAMQQVETGTLTVSDLDVRLEAGAEVADFGSVASQLRSALPSEFKLTALQADAQAVEPEAGPAEFTTTRSPEGLVQLRGRVADDLSRTAILSLARALFGTDHVSASVEVAEPTPTGWGPEILASLDALSRLNHGVANVAEDGISVTGVSGNADAPSAVARLLSGRLGEGADYDIDISYDKRLDAALALPTPDECVDQVNAILSERQITFDPGSATIDPASRDSVDAIAEIVGKCESVRMEVGGFTDSQGREEMNKALSQSRAEAVLAALLARRVPVGDLTAVGYGEADPIADNASEAGREANRRIEFRLLEGDETEEAAETEDASDAEDTGDDATDEETGGEEAEAESGE